jgi:hypothetical protein
MLCGFFSLHFVISSFKFKNQRLLMGYKLFFLVAKWLVLESIGLVLLCQHDKTTFDFLTQVCEVENDGYLIIEIG